MEAPRQLLLMAIDVAAWSVSHAGKESAAVTCFFLSAQPAMVLAFGASWCKGLVLADHGGQTPPFLPPRSTANLGLLSSQTERGLLKCSVP